MQHECARGMAAIGGEFEKRLLERCRIRIYIVAICRDSVALGDIERAVRLGSALARRVVLIDTFKTGLATENKEDVRIIKALKNSDHSVGFSVGIEIRQGNGLSFARFGDKQHPFRVAYHDARAGNVLRIH